MTHNLADLKKTNSLLNNVDSVLKKIPNLDQYLSKTTKRIEAESIASNLLDKKSTKVEIQNKVNESSNSNEYTHPDQLFPGSFASWADVQLA